MSDQNHRLDGLQTDYNRQALDKSIEIKTEFYTLTEQELARIHSEQLRLTAEAERIRKEFEDLRGLRNKTMVTLDATRNELRELFEKRFEPPKGLIRVVEKDKNTDQQAS